MITVHGLRLELEGLTHRLCKLNVSTCCTTQGISLAALGHHGLVLGVDLALGPEEGRRELQEAVAVEVGLDGGDVVLVVDLALWNTIGFVSGLVLSRVCFSCDSIQRLCFSVSRCLCVP